MNDSPSIPLLTAEHILGWVVAHRDLKIEIGERIARAREIEGKINGLGLYLPPDVISGLVGDWEPIAEAGVGGSTREGTKSPPRKETFKTLILDLLGDQDGGRSVRWLREQIENNPATAHRLPHGSANLTTALSRMRDRGELIQTDSLYYLPSLHAKILRGEVQDQRIVEIAPRRPMTHGMREIIAELGRSAVAGKIVEKALMAPEIVDATSDVPAAVYRWLSREYSKGHIYKNGAVYSLEPAPPGDQNEDGASSLFAASRSVDEG